MFQRTVWHLLIEKNVALVQEEKTLQILLLGVVTMIGLQQEGPAATNWTNIL